MAIRKIEYTVTESEVTPNSAQWGGMQFEDNATTVEYRIYPPLISSLTKMYGTLAYRIDFNSPTAGYQPSPNLAVTDNTVSRDIPGLITQHGGQATVSLEITAFNIENKAEITVLSAPGTVYFTPVVRSEHGIWRNLSEYEIHIEEEIGKAAKAAGEAIAEVAESIPKKVSQLENDSKYVDETKLGDAVAEVVGKIPKKVSQLENDSKYVSKSELDGAIGKAAESIPKKVSQLENDSKYVDETKLGDAVAEMNGMISENVDQLEEAIVQAALDAGGAIAEVAESIPKKVSQLENDSGYVDKSELDGAIGKAAESIPKKVSQLENDSGYVDEAEVKELINSAGPADGVRIEDDDGTAYCGKFCIKGGYPALEITKI